MLTETIAWRPVADGLPDAELTVLIACDTKFHSEPVWIGFHDGEAWREANGEPAFVTHWAQLPAAPADVRMHEQKGESVQAHVQAAAHASVPGTRRRLTSDGNGGFCIVTEPDPAGVKVVAPPGHFFAPPTDDAGVMASDGAQAKGGA